MTRQSLALAPPRVERRILLLRGERVILDEDLAALYGVETTLLTRAVRRNAERFPSDFMFQLTTQEHAALRIQSGTSNAGRGGRRYRPYAFTDASPATNGVEIAAVQPADPAPTGAAAA
jgi:hypothetical protein